MAQQQSKLTEASDPAQGPVLRQGRAADPAPATVQASAKVPVKPARVPAPTRDAVEATLVNQPQKTGSESESEPVGATAAEKPGVEPERVLAESRQRKLRLMLRQCDRVLLMDFDLLAMNGWPDNFAMAEARRNRDLWLFTALIAGAIFLSGLTGFIPAWIAGGGFGAFVIILLLGIPAVRRIYTSKPSYLDLVVTRQRMLREARLHVAHLEGPDGLIWQCARMSDFNPALRNSRFSRLLTMSENRVLSRHLTRREHVRLYLMYLMEAEKAYSRVQKAFFEGNQTAIDKGWREVAAEPEPKT